MASYLEARQRAGAWLLRIEDVDPPREQAGAATRILRALERYGFEWDGNPVFQKDSAAAHVDALETLLRNGHAYRCGCSRSDLADAPRGPLGVVYPGTCRGGSDAEETAVRVRTRGEPVEFEDALQGRQRQRLEPESGDFVIWRRDGLVAYHLAVVVDDHLQNVTEIVRGTDLMDSTPRQIWLQRLLDYVVPNYAHIPVAINAAGQKLSKATGAREVPLRRVQPTLVRALAALRQAPPGGLGDGSVTDIWDWALQNWDSGKLRGIRQLPARADAMAKYPPS